MKKKSQDHKKTNSPMLDLHGVSEDEVFDLVDRFFTKHNDSKSSQVRIMPGKGKGILKKKLLEYLRLANYSWTYEKLANGTLNEGVLIIHL